MLRCDADEAAILPGHRQHLETPPATTYGPQCHAQHVRPFALRTYYGDAGFDIPRTDYYTVLKSLR
jgi:hypothetical protein